MLLERSSEAQWEGSLKGGKGSFRSGSGEVEGRFDFGRRFGETPGTNPEELLAAAHAACLSMALAATLERKFGVAPQQVKARSTCLLELQEAGPRITGFRVQVQVQVAGLTEEQIREAVHEAAQACPVSRAYKEALPVEVTDIQVR